MQGFVQRKIPLLVRRGLTMIPALIVLGAGVSATDALVASQVVLSFGIPFALIPLVLLTSDRELMGEHVNGLALKVVAWTLAALISRLNVYLLLQQFVVRRDTARHVAHGRRHPLRHAPARGRLAARPGRGRRRRHVRRQVPRARGRGRSRSWPS